MLGLGTLINVAAIVAGGVAGQLCGRAITVKMRETLGSAVALCCMFVGIAGTLEQMFHADGSVIRSSGALMTVGAFALGSALGAWLDIEGWFVRFGEWVKQKSGNASDRRFTDAFVTASLTVCIGAMAVVGSIQDGMRGDITILATKAVMDAIIIMVMTASLGRGCIFSAIPVLLFQGAITLAAGLLEPLMTEAALSNIGLTGSMMIFCVGVNIIWGQKFSVANMLPTLIFAPLFAFFA